jgi:hypothetical protein
VQNVELASGGDTFFSDHAEFEFDALGELERSTLTGHPRGDVEVGRFLTAERPELSGARAHLTGAGPLVVTRVDGDTVEMAGPLVLEVPEAAIVLHATDKLVGHDDPTKKSGRMDASGDVVLDYGANKLRSSEVSHAWQLVAGAPVALVSTTGVTTLDAVTTDGRKATMVARGGLGGTVTKKKATITEARDVEITSAERGGLSAKAKVVRDFDTEAPHVRGGG